MGLGIFSGIVGSGDGSGGGGGGGGTPAGPSGAIQFNNAGSFGGSADFTRDLTTGFVTTGDASLLDPTSQIAQLSIANTVTDAVIQDVGSLQIVTKIVPAADYTGSYYGAVITATVDASSTHSITDVFAQVANTNINSIASTPSSAEGLQGSVNLNVAGTLGSASGVSGAIVNSGGTIIAADAINGRILNFSGDMTDAVTLHAVSPLISAGVVTNLYGLLVDDITGATNNWAIKTGLGLVEFGDSLKLNADVTLPFLMKKNTQSATAPGAGFACLRWEADTGNTAKLVAYAGTSATGVVIVSGVGGSF